MIDGVILFAGGVNMKFIVWHIHISIKRLSDVLPVLFEFIAYFYHTETIQTYFSREMEP